MAKLSHALSFDTFNPSSLHADVNTPATQAEQTDTIADQLCDQLRSQGMTPTLAKRVASWAQAGGGYNRQEMIDRAAYFVRLVVDRIASARRPRAQAEAFRIAFGFHRNVQDSIRSSARRVGLTPWGLKKQANAIRLELRLSNRNSFDGAGRHTSGARACNGQWQKVLPETSVHR